ncbi:5-formyltetrahydrofolate cyclo-ligase [Pisolithus tinctorius]|nr:5-formyltetrahydrofolate cyclo-ligase [Pisolithus tinctorius]
MIRANKRALRKAMRTTLGELPAEDIQFQSQAIAAKVMALPAFQNSRTFSCYLSMPTAEVQTTSLILDILANKQKKLFVPTIVSENDYMDFVRLHDEQDFHGLPIGLWGIPQPTAQWNNEKRQSVLDTSAEDLDVVLLPGVAFDRSLSRLGHGKGYYDKFLSSYTAAAKRPRPLLVALALQQQLLDAGSVPITDTDWKVDMIITPSDIVTKENLPKDSAKA